MCQSVSSQDFLSLSLSHTHTHTILSLSVTRSLCLFLSLFPRTIYCYTMYKVLRISRGLSLSLSHAHTHKHSLSRSHTRTHTFSGSLAYSLSFSFAPSLVLLPNPSTHGKQYIWIWFCSSQTMGWLQVVGSLKLWVSFAKEPHERDDILQKIPKILRSQLLVTTPYPKSDVLLAIKSPRTRSAAARQ